MSDKLFLAYAEAVARAAAFYLDLSIMSGMPEREFRATFTKWRKGLSISQSDGVRICRARLAEGLPLPWDMTTDAPLSRWLD